MTWQILTGDCIEQMRTLPDESIDAVVTDPPYELGFMGKGWDASGIANSVEMWSEALRVLKPGGHLLSFGGTRTYHRMVCAVEDAGFEIRDQIAWMFGSGFPKSLDVSKAIDKAAGHQRGSDYEPNLVNAVYGNAMGGGRTTEADPPITPEAQQWQGWGTALKPAHEPIVVARKPLTGTVAANVLEHGTGAINVDGCRIAADGEVIEREDVFDADTAAHAGYVRPGASKFTNKPKERSGPAQESGRWPANVILDPEAGRLLDEQTGAVGGNHCPADASGTNKIYGDFAARTNFDLVGYGDTGGASRFFYCAKTSSAERNAGLDGFEPGAALPSVGRRRCKVCEKWQERPPQNDFEPCRCEFPKWENVGSTAEYRNVHPTVKPIALMRWLVRLVTPPNGTILDPFNGSGSTGCAAVLEGFNYIGIEREAEYVAIAEARIKWWSEHPEGVDIEDGLKAERERKKVVESGQLDMFGEAAA